jgi:tRNA G18 (ribose-2'-O)-methylase SpoU
MTEIRGYVGLGVEGLTKEQNLGTLLRTAHAFGADFFFCIRPEIDLSALRASDTSRALEKIPFYVYPSIEEMKLPENCRLVGLEFTDEAQMLPSYRHPSAAAYILGPEMGDLSPEAVQRCDHLVKIPTRFSINVGIAGALVLYDRAMSHGKFAPRPVTPGLPHTVKKLPEKSHRIKLRRPRK